MCDDLKGASEPEIPQNRKIWSPDAINFEMEFVCDYSTPDPIYKKTK